MNFCDIIAVKKVIYVLDKALLGKNIKFYRERARLTQSILAERLFVSFQAISSWERGITAPDIENIIVLAELFGVSVDDLLGLSSQQREIYIGVDAGGTKTEFVAFDSNGSVLAVTKKGAGNPNDIGVDGCVQMLKSGITELCSGLTVKGVFAGISGAGVGSNKTDIQQKLSKYFDNTLIGVDTDAANVLSLGDNPEQSIAVISGTGSAVFVRKNNSVYRVGGWGFLFDNTGSGYDIGRDGICHCLAVEDTLENGGVLYGLITEKLCGNTMDALMDIYSKGKSYIASFAPTVFEACRQGDKAAESIINSNATGLAKRINFAVNKYDIKEKAACCGGMFNNPEFKDCLEKSCNTDIFIPDVPAVYGACKECARMFSMQVDEAFKNNFKTTYLLKGE